MAARTYVSLGQVISQDVWPSDVFGTADFDFLDAIAYVDGKIFDDDLYTNIVLDLEVVQELTFDLPFGLALVVGAGPVSFTMTGDDLGFTSWTDAGVLKLRLPRELFVPLIEGTTDVDPDPTRFVEITFDVGMSFDSRGNIDLAWPAEGPTPLTLERCMIGNTGVIISAEDVLIRLSEEQQLPDEAAALGIGPDFRGLFIGEATVELAGDLADAIPAGSELKFKNCLIGTGGFTGTLTVIPGASPQAQLFGASFTFQSFELEIVQNALTKFEIKGALDLAVLDDPLDVVVSVDLVLTSTGPGFAWRTSRSTRTATCASPAAGSICPRRPRWTSTASSSRSRASASAPPTRARTGSGSTAPSASWRGSRRAPPSTGCASSGAGPIRRRRRASRWRGSASSWRCRGRSGSRDRSR
jgi:hypothetical protein